MKRLSKRLTGKSKTLFLYLFLLPLFLFILLIDSAHSLQSKVYIKELKNGHYQLFVQKKPYVIKGLWYNPIPIGKNYEYDWWSDPNKPWIVDGKLMKEMGINTVRFDKLGNNPEEVRQVIRDLYQFYGIRSVIGHQLGLWEYPHPSYDNKDFQDKIKKEVLNIISLYKDEEGVLFWVLGHNNNYSFSGQIKPWSNREIDKETDPAKQNYLRARIYYSFVNDLAQEIHKIDPNRPVVAMGNQELIGLEVANEVCPDIDLVACIMYRGKTFGNLFQNLKMIFDRPVVIAEFGADSYDAYKRKEDANMQAEFLESQWKEINENLAGNKKGMGNCLGGIMYGWTDEWWKDDIVNKESWLVHDTSANWGNPAYYFDIKAADNKNMNDEWFGIVALSPELEDGINKRVPKKAFYTLKEILNR